MTLLGRQRARIGAPLSRAGVTFDPAGTERYFRDWTQSRRRDGESDEHERHNRAERAA